ncbi:Multidrug efflux pump subunit AcrB [Nitrosomonas aestuarii]|uniref:Multidrug efflux pump subunit AcrB n=1 Tax=Nitrosomonas aestuarii TaxID=52441 RepID=A0A1I3XUB6_9PROT|nr:efflux RND transporter permease subunit [Nitrosomonas aestuarii]SFK22606.1 Multidrug efflux pump subunit AcrB [Nitrosomonas aestuarii]
MKLIIWFAKNPIAANLLMLLIIAGGIVGLSVAQRYVYPPEPQHQFMINTVYDGASPSEVEQAVCIPTEEAIHDLQGLRHIYTIAQQAFCHVTVDFDPAIDAARFQTEVQARVEAVTTFPRNAEKFVIQELKTGVQALIVVVRGAADMHILQHYRDQLQGKLSTHPDIGPMLAFPKIPYEISIEVSESNLRRYALSLDEIAESIRAVSKNIPAGELKSNDGKLLIRSQAQALTADDFAAIALRPEREGMQLRLGEIAQIYETVRDQDIRVRSDGIPAMEILIWPKNQIGATVNAVHEIVAAFQSELPAGIEVITWDDWSKYYNQNMSMLTSNAIVGFILIFIILSLTLRLRLALWVSSGILVAVFGTFWFIPILGISLNTYTIAAVILILGVVVDDAIIVGEHIHTHQQQGNPGLSGAITGAREMAPLVVLMVLSTMVAFIPGLLIQGLTGHLLYNVSIVVILALTFSIVEALLILPAHLAGSHAPVNQRLAGASWIQSLQMRVDQTLQWLINQLYVRVLHMTLRLRYITIAAFAVLLLMMAALVISGRITSVLDAPVDDYYLHADLMFPAGTTFEEVDRQILRLESIANEIRTDLNTLPYQDSSEPDHDSMRHILTLVNDNRGFVNLELAVDERVRTRMEDIKKQWRERFGALPADTTLTIQSFWPRNLGIPSDEAPKAIEWVLIATDSAQQGAAGEILKNKLAAYTGVHSVTSSMQPGKPELHLKLKPAAKHYGLTMRSLNEQVRHSFFGLEVQRYYQGRNEIRVMLRFPPVDKQTLDNLHAMPITLDNGRSVPFSTVAEVVYTPGYAVIKRTNRERIHVIGAEVYQDEADVETILTDMRNNVIPQLEVQFPGLTVKPGQSRQKQEEMMSELWLYGAMALLGIYALLAVPLRSYTQPFIIMLVIPFGFIGAVAGHLLLCIPLSLESYFALFAVGGIVINDSLILIAQSNKNMQQGIPAIEAVMLAGKSRFRAIFLTTITTFVGLLPLLSTQGYDAEKIMPMAVTIAFGVLFAFFVTLFLVPAAYVTFSKHDLKNISR